MRFRPEYLKFLQPSDGKIPPESYSAHNARGGTGVAIDDRRRFIMEGPGRGCLAGLISWKLGGGLISMIVIFVIAYVLLGQVHC